jgi:hypothetical protein
VTIELLRVLLKHNACPIEQARELLKHPRMREHLAPESWHLARLKLEIEDKHSKGPQPPASIADPGAPFSRPE